MNSIMGHAMMMASAGGSATDPYFANVSSLLHFDASFVDQKGKVWTPGSGTSIDTVSPIVGSGSAYFNGTTSSRVTSVSSSDFAFGLGPFTVEFMLKLDGAQNGKYFFDMGAGNRLVISTSSTGKLSYFDPNAGTGGSLYNGGPTPTPGTAGHVAISRGTDGVLRAFYDGVQWGSFPSNYNVTDTVALLGRYGGSTGLEGKFWMDELRITKGVGRYGSNFTPPTVPFPDS